VAYLLWMVNAVAQGPAQYQRFLDQVGSPWFVALNVLALAFLLYHTVTFIGATPQAVVVKPFGRTVPGPLLAAAVFGAWLVVSAFLAWLVVVD
jgi:succinate dehydrogenase subunit C